MKLQDLINFEVLSFSEICRRIATNQNFSIARYGDGEFNAILGKQGGNCDGHQYYPEMGRELVQILSSSPSYYVGLHEKGKLERATLDFIEKHIISSVFIPNAVFHDATIGKTKGQAEKRQGLFDLFWQSCELRTVSLIAPMYVFKQECVRLDKFNNLAIPGKKTYEYLDDIKLELNKLDFTGNVVLICASMCAPILVDYLYNQYGERATFIDFGSSFDPYLGNAPFKRSFHKNKMI